jgi:hypothetical protein
MANRKISDLTALTTTATGDLLPIVDISEVGAVDQNKKITVENLFKGIPGSVGIGTTSPAGALDVRTAGNAFQAYIGTNSGTSANDAGFVFQNTPSATASSRSCILYFDANGANAIGGDYFYISNTGDNVASIWNQGGGPIVFGRSSTESVRIDSSGRVGIGTSSIYSATRADAYTDNGSWFVQTFRQDNATGYGIGIGSDSTALAYFYPNSGLSGGPVGTITHNGSSTTYATSSDYRLKENVVPLAGAIDRVNDLQVRRFNFIVDPDHTVDGFIAHEAQAVVPECVTGTKDEVDDDGNPIYQGIDQSKLVPLLTAALQEAIAKIETLEARLTAAGIA